MFEFKNSIRDPRSRARTGEFVTPHGILQTPALAIVGTEGKIRSIDAEITSSLPIPYAIVNTFHILTKNILPEIERTGTVHNFGQFPGVIASDSGGFQVFSLGFGKTHNVGKHGTIEIKSEQLDKNNPLTISEEGVTFQWNDEDIVLTPERSMEIQHRIGADIIFAFDECTSPLNSRDYIAASVEKTNRWLGRCVEAHKDLSVREKNDSAHKGNTPGARKNPQALFAIVQGGEYEDLRVRSAKYCAEADVPGFGIGGSFGGSFGDSKQNMHRVIEWIIPHLPDEKPRHLLGIGQVDDIFESVERGVDLFDCVIPTREARHRILYTKQGKKAIKKIKTLDEPIEKGCGCIACHENITGRQLYELFLQRDPRAFFYTTVHNIQFFGELMGQIRESIVHGSFTELKEEFLPRYRT